MAVFGLKKQLYLDN